jgi:hypothetical protein
LKAILVKSALCDSRSRLCISMPELSLAR